MDIIQLHKHLAQLARQRSFIHAAKVIAALNPITEPPQTFSVKITPLRPGAERCLTAPGDSKAPLESHSHSERARTPRQIGVAEFAGPGVDVLEDEEGGP